MPVGPSRSVGALLGCLLSLSAVVTSLLPLEIASARADRAAPVGSDKFQVSRGYSGDFPDPSVIRFRGVWYAYSTTVSSLNLPVLASRDLVHWRAVGEGLRRPARWAQARRIGGRWHATTWAPAVARFGRRFVHAYATPVRGVSPRKMCISISTSRRPMRGFVDRTRRPLLCPGDRGAIDPSFFVAPGGGRYLVWKSEQGPGIASQLWSTPLTADGRHLAGPSSLLLTTQEPWEGALIENPSMVAYAGRYFLFYSGGSYANDTYATGYATCATPVGPCTRVGTEPLLATGGAVSGPGGAAAFFDVAGRLRLAYAAWDFGNTGYPATTACKQTVAGCPQRRMHIATLAPDPEGSGGLVVTARG